ncbi:MAG: hypothetical protein U9N04_00250 [Patescibacteria group bacterium]|nr:hypothetical protein [Patescibacteria group bacterium]
MKIEKIIKSSFDHKKTLKILDDYFVSIGYKITADRESLIYGRGSMSGSLFSPTPKQWKSIVNIEISGREKNVIVKINADINTIGQMVVKKERDFLENEFSQIENILLDENEDDKYEHNNISTPVNQKTASGINSSQQKDIMISLSEFPRLKAVALIFIALGIAEVIFIVNALTSGQNFATSFIFVFYAFVGFKLLLFKNGIKIETYKKVRNLISFFFVLAFAAVLFEIMDLFFFLSVKSVSLEYGTKGLADFFIPVFFLSHLALVYLLNRPLIKQRELLLKPIKHSLFIIGGVLALLFMSILSGPHLVQNSFQSIVDTAVADQQIKKDVGEIEKFVLNKNQYVFNWVFFSEWDIVGNRCRGTYAVEVSPKYEVTFGIRKLQCPEDGQQTQNREYVPSLIKDISIKQTSKAIDGILLSTSFENLDPSSPEIITPFINTGKTKWQIYMKDSKTGKYSLNVLPDGNFPEGFGGFFPGFSDGSQNSAIINSVFSNKYEPFDVSNYDRIEFEFWRYSSSSPNKKDDFSLGDLKLKYRIDRGEWKSAMSFCGEHRLETRGWRFSSLTFDTKNKSTIEFKFEYDSFMIREEDATAFYLIDDLQIKGFKGNLFKTK